MKVVINASNVAAFIGKNPYVTKREGILAAWRSSDIESYKSLFQRNNIITPEAKKSQLRKEKSDTIKMTIDAWKESPASAFTWKRDTYRELHTQPAEEYTTVNKMVMEMVACDIGTENEHVILDRVNRVLGLSLKPRYDKIQRTFEYDGHEVVVQGYVDADGHLPCGGHVIMEIKTRMYKLFKKVKEYESIQVETYVWLANSPRCKAYLAEGYFRTKGAPPDVNVQCVLDFTSGTLSEFVPEWEPEFWDSVGLLIRLMSGPQERQDTFLVT